MFVPLLLVQTYDWIGWTLFLMEFRIIRQVFHDEVLTHLFSKKGRVKKVFRRKGDDTAT